MTVDTPISLDDYPVKMQIIIDLMRHIQNYQRRKTNTLVTIPKYQESQVSVAPDGLGILFERSLDRVDSGTPGEKKIVFG